jgi:hypothetical protein
MVTPRWETASAVRARSKEEKSAGSASQTIHMKILTRHASRSSAQSVLRYHQKCLHTGATQRTISVDRPLSPRRKASKISRRNTVKLTAAASARCRAHAWRSSAPPTAYHKPPQQQSTKQVQKHPTNTRRNKDRRVRSHLKERRIDGRRLVHEVRADVGKEEQEADRVQENRVRDLSVKAGSTAKSVG